MNFALTDGSAPELAWNRLIHVPSYCHPETGLRARAKRLKFFVRGCLWLTQTSRWLDAIQRDPLLRGIAAHNRRLLEKPHRPLLRKDLGIGRRVELLISHYRSISGLCRDAALRQIYLGNGYRLATLEGGDGFELWLRNAGKNEKEGELALCWIDRKQQRRLAQLSFSLLASPTGVDIYIGGLQGPATEDAKELICTATKACQGLRPKRAVMEGLYVIAQIFGAERILAVSNEQHVARSWRVRRAVNADYNSFWEEFGGKPDAGGNFCLLRQMPRRAIEDVPSRKRAEFRRRRELTAALIRQSRDTLQECVAVGGVYEEVTAQAA